MQFLHKEIPYTYNLKLKFIKMQGVFRKIENREQVIKLLENRKIKCVLDGSWSADVTEEVSQIEYKSE